MSTTDKPSDSASKASGAHEAGPSATEAGEGVHSEPLARVSRKERYLKPPRTTEEAAKSFTEFLAGKPGTRGHDTRRAHARIYSSYSKMTGYAWLGALCCVHACPAQHRHLAMCCWSCGVACVLTIASSRVRRCACAWLRHFESGEEGVTPRRKPRLQRIAAGCLCVPLLAPTRAAHRHWALISCTNCTVQARDCMRRELSFVVAAEAVHRRSDATCCAPTCLNVHVRTAHSSLAPAWPCGTVAEAFFPIFPVLSHNFPPPQRAPERLQHGFPPPRPGWRDARLSACDCCTPADARCCFIRIRGSHEQHLESWLA